MTVQRSGANVVLQSNVYDADGKRVKKVEFDIQVSTNGTTWTTVASRSGQTTAQKYVFAITPVTARYVRVTNVLSKYTANSNWHYVYATELQVYSTATWGGAVTPIKHYDLGGRRIATRDADGLKYLHTDHLGFSPAQGYGALNQLVLQILAFQVLFDLLRRRLPDVDVGLSFQVLRENLGMLTHRSPPGVAGLWPVA